VPDEGEASFVECALEPFDPALAVVMRAVVRTAGVDVTGASARRSCLVVAPHPDDETLGAGATIMRKVDAGTPVHVLVATDGSKAPAGDPLEVAALRARELAAACEVLGVPAERVTRLGFVDAELDGADETLVASIAEAVDALRPDEVLVTGETDPHPDHAALAVGVRTALAGTGVRMLVYPIWQFDRPARLVRQLWRSGRPELVSTAGYRRRKQMAVAAYPSQMAARHDDPEGLHPRFLRHFDRPYEVFFPVDTERVHRRGRRRG
jgi:LmbE family N-acetylglucosaminyl deacetylase